eukprot:TRINITY_DN10428_c0_g1_i1.p1 TRINITY_DN10428_c0_g1~~TRINITY_DN10428_c0_g1_i1.p1  ORF type:complete len:264 (+),score=74.67 TRINITY_DN10428_c0_g1_i1:76-867(+)
MNTQKLTTKTKKLQKLKELPLPKDADYDFLASLTPRQRKLHLVRKQKDIARHEIRKAVIEEDRRNHEENKKDSWRQEPSTETKKKDNNNNHIETKPLTKEEKEKLQLLSTTAEDAEYHEQKKNKKKRRREDTFGWGRYNDDAQYNAYRKRQNEMKFDEKEYEREKLKIDVTDENSVQQFYRDANYLDYGQDDEVDKRKVDLMVQDLKKMEDRRQNYSRRRTHQAEEDVDFINERNRVFNKKIKRAYDPYTVEIRQNLERGTAT